MSQYRPKADPRVSLALPVFNEEALIHELVSRCLAVLDATPGGPHEICIVDDGSRDQTLELLRQAASGDSRLKVIALSRNFGHQTAITAALDHATGDVVLVMDGDLQDPPELLPSFLERYREGFEVVYARRRARKESWPLRMAYHLFYRVIAVLSDIALPVDSGDFALLSRRVVDALKQTPEHNRYLRGLRTWVGFRQCPLVVDRAARAAGDSKYSIGKLIRLAFDGIFAFSLVPLRAATVLGSVVITLSLFYGLYALAALLLYGSPPRGFTGLLLVMVFTSGVQLMFLGVLGEYIGRIYQEVKRRPHYFIQEIIHAPTGE
jgi:polyisoprenyl-phosphate glycosyltransferase